MTKKIKKTKIGVRGRRLKIEPEKSDSILSNDDGNLVQKGVVLDAGPEAKCKKGDVVIFNAWGVDKIEINGQVFYYVLDTDEFILEVV